MSLDTRIADLILAVGADIKSILAAQGNLAALSTTAKGSLVAAINELQSALSSAGGSSILDTAGAGDTAHTWSADRIVAGLAQLKTDILGNVDAAHDTLEELVSALSSTDGALGGLLTAVGNRVRFDAVQTLTTAEKLQACQNLGVGNPDADLVAAYNAAKA